MTIGDKKALDSNFIKSFKDLLGSLSLTRTTLAKGTITSSSIEFELLQCHRRCRKDGLNRERHCKFSVEEV